jgi:pimeloyl-ACP methyl ester carboxylesterase
MYHDLPLQEAQGWISKLRPQSLATFEDKTRSAAWRKIPTSYLVCEDDRAIPMEGQEAMIARIKEEGGDIEVERLFVSHSPYVAKPEETAAFLERAAIKVSV